MCFEHRKGRTRYLGQADLYVCLNGPCLEEHTRRKKLAREKLGAERGRREGGCRCGEGEGARREAAREGGGSSRASMA